MADPWREAFLTVSDWANGLTETSDTTVAASREGQEIRLGYARDGVEDVLVLRADLEGGEPVIRTTRRELSEDGEPPAAGGGSS